MPWVKFSPFYPHGNIPIPLSNDAYGNSVEGIWQGLKVFERESIDPSKFLLTKMAGIKRTSRTFGKVIGHQAGLDCQQLLGYIEARKKIYLPAYRWVLDHYLQAELTELKIMAEQRPIIFLDYETNPDIENPAKPLSHASLVISYLLSEWPDYSTEAF